MPTSAENAATARGNLEVALVNATARLAELDAVSIAERARMTYTDGQQTYDWNGYRAALVGQIRETKDLIASLQGVAGPFTLHSVVR